MNNSKKEQEIQETGSGKGLTPRNAGSFSAPGALESMKAMGIAPRDLFEKGAGLGLQSPLLNIWGPHAPSYPGTPGLAGPWGEVGKPYDGRWFKDYSAIDRAMESQRHEEERMKHAALDAIRRQYDSQALGQMHSQLEKTARANQARTLAEGIETAQGPLGARHFLRQALGAGHEIGLRRCWAAVTERGWEVEVLAEGKSETLLAAALGAGALAALAFLAEMGFNPGAKLATQALRAAMAGNSVGAALESLCRDFGAGALNEEVITDLNRRQKGLGELARSQGEAYELGAFACQKVLVASTGSRRL